MAKRYSGQVVLNVEFVDAYSNYLVRIKTPSGSGTEEVGVPPALKVAVDSAEAYDGAASAALSFAVDDHPDIGIEDYASTNMEGSGWHIGRSEKAAWPAGTKFKGLPAGERRRRKSREGGRHTKPAPGYGPTLKGTSSKAPYGYALCPECGHPNVHVDADGNLQPHGAGQYMCPGSGLPARSGAGERRRHPASTKQKRQYDHLVKRLVAQGWSHAEARQIVQKGVRAAKKLSGGMHRRGGAREGSTYKVEACRGSRARGAKGRCVWTTEGHFHSRAAAEAFAQEFSDSTGLRTKIVGR